MVLAKTDTWNSGRSSSQSWVCIFHSLAHLLHPPHPAVQIFLKQMKKILNLNCTLKFRFKFISSSVCSTNTAQRKYILNLNYILKFRSKFISSSSCSTNHPQQMKYIWNLNFILNFRFKSIFFSSCRTKHPRQIKSIITDCHFLSPNIILCVSRF